MSTRSINETIQQLQERFDAEHETLARVVAERNELRAALQRIADYPSGYQFSGVQADDNPVGKEREEMIHIARSVLREQEQRRAAASTTTGRG